MPDTPEAGLTRSEQTEVEDRAAPRAPVIHAVVRRQGEEELRRPTASLLWSGVAGGMTMMASVIAEGALTQKLPGQEAISALGYSLGFLMVVLGRMQLFTEQTIVATLPVLAAPGWRILGAAAWLWLVVFCANMAGAAAAAWINLELHLVSEPLRAGMLEVSARLLERTPLETLAQAIPAGFLVASIAWIRAGVSSGEVMVVLALTYAIAIGGFAHVVAGAAEAFLLVVDGRIGLGQALFGLILPALIGNVIGGTGLFALLAHAQVRQEI